MTKLEDRLYTALKALVGASQLHRIGHTAADDALAEYEAGQEPRRYTVLLPNGHERATLRELCVYPQEGQTRPYEVVLRWQNGASFLSGRVTAGWSWSSWDMSQNRDL